MPNMPEKRALMALIRAIKPISIARIIIATLKPARIYSPSISKKLWDSCSFSSLISGSASGRTGLMTERIIKVLNMFRISAATTNLASSIVI